MESLSRPRRLFLSIAPFPALAFFKIWASFEPSSSSLTLVSGLLLAYCLVVLGIARRWDKPTYFDWVIAAYFAVIFLSLGTWPDSAGPFLSLFSVTGIYACLFTAAFSPPCWEWTLLPINMPRNPPPGIFGKTRFLSKSTG